MDTPTFLCLKEDIRGFEPRVSLVFFMDFVCVWSRSFLPANKVLLHLALKTPGDFLIWIYTV